MNINSIHSVLMASYRQWFKRWSHQKNKDKRWKNRCHSLRATSGAGAAIGAGTYGSVKKITINNSDDLTLLNIPDLAAINYVKIDDVDFNIESSKSKNNLYLYLTRVDHSVTIKDIEYFVKYIQESDTFNLTKETEDETPPEEINTAPVITATDISLK